MWFYYSLFLLAGILVHKNVYSSILLMITVSISCWIKFQHYKILLCGCLFILCGILIYPKIDKKPLKTFNEASYEVTHYDKVRFEEAMSIDGNLLKTILTIKEQQYQAFYTIKNKKEKQFLEKKVFLFNVCHAKYIFSEPIRNTNNLHFDYSEYLFQNDLINVVQIESIDFSTCNLDKLSTIENIQKYREHLIVNLKNTNISSIDDVIALTLGETRFISNNKMTQLKQLGIYHLYAISGSHVALLSVFLFKLLLKINLSKNIVEHFMLMMLPTYAILTGLSPSVNRAVSVVIIFIIIRRFYNIDALQVLSISFLITIIWTPKIIHDIGFQLSYMISAFLILSVPSLKTLSTVKKILISNFIAQIASFIILIIHFNSFQWVGLLSNLIFIPIFELLLFPLCTAILILFIILGFIPNTVRYLIDSILNKNEMIINYMSSLQLPDLIVKNLYPPIYMLFILVSMAIITYYFKRNTYALLHLVLCIFILYFTMNIKKDEVIIKFLDVGQGDSMVAYHEDVKKVVMIDTGGKMIFNQAKWQKRKRNISLTQSVLTPELYMNGYNKIDYLIITHPDTDHMGEMINLAKKVKIKKIIVNKIAWKDHELEEKLNILDEMKIKIIDIKNLTKLKVGKTQYKFLNRSPSISADSNEMSIITEIKIYHYKLLTTGDATTQNEREILKEIETNYDFLKVGHHGSSTSSDEKFLDKVHPKHCVISAGRKNRYGHPSEEVVLRLNKVECNILNIQDKGSIKLTFKKGKIKIETALDVYNK